MDFPPELFLEYIKPDADRADFIQNFLMERGVKSHRTLIDGKSHILVQFDSRFYNPQFKIKTVIAHYDRAPGSPGANDNSAADWMIMNWAVTLQQMRTFHNVRIIFTDGEELGWNIGVSEQGAFGLASVFRRLGMTDDDIFVFDSCGRGDVPVLAKTVLPPRVSKKFQADFSDLYERTQDILRRSCPGKWVTLPVPYSDNASFLACGIPAVALTMLPSDEATRYAKDLVSDSSLVDAVMNREATKLERMRNPGTDDYYRSKMPLTWRLFHSESDGPGTLTPDSFRIMANILRTLAEMRTPNF
ncbi:MAG: M28 family peptidase [Treponema sp.]|nr:M28 family peptidase [Treponema sp.]